MGPPLKLGIDLSGGVILVYEVDQTKMKPGETVDMDKLIAAVARRVNPGGQKEVTIRKYGTQQIEVIVPEVEKPKWSGSSGSSAPRAISSSASWPTGATTRT